MTTLTKRSARPAGLGVTHGSEETESGIPGGAGGGGERSAGVSLHQSYCREETGFIWCVGIVRRTDIENRVFRDIYAKALYRVRG